MRTLKRTLVIRADGTARVISRRKSLKRWDEIGFNLTINIPDTWGSVLGDIEVTLPEPPVPEARVDVSAEG